MILVGLFWFVSTGFAGFLTAVVCVGLGLPRGVAIPAGLAVYFFLTSIGIPIGYAADELRLIRKLLSQQPTKGTEHQ